MSIRDLRDYADVLGKSADVVLSILYKRSEPGTLQLHLIKDRNKCTAMVVWDLEFATDQLERMMRAPEVFPQRVLFNNATNPCGVVR